MNEQKRCTASIVIGIAKDCADGNNVYFQKV